MKIKANIKIELDIHNIPEFYKNKLPKYKTEVHEFNNIEIVFDMYEIYINDKINKKTHHFDADYIKTLTIEFLR